MPYLVIDADRAIVSGGIVAAQTAADTLAATNSEWTAHQGDVTDPAFHANAEPGWFLTAAGVTVLELPLTALEELKVEMSAAHHYMIALQEQLHIEGNGRSWEEVTIVHNYFARVHQSNFRIVKDNIPNFTIAERRKYAVELVAGPQNAALVRLSIPELFDAIIDPSQTLNGQGVTYVNPATGLQITVALSMALSSQRSDWGLGTDTDPLVISEAQLVSGLWTETITGTT